jgi:hypothetical protein
VRKALGPAVEPHMLKLLEGDDSRHHSSALRELSELESPAKATCARLQAFVADKDQHRFLKDLAEKPLRKCR